MNEIHDDAGGADPVRRLGRADAETLCLLSFLSEQAVSATSLCAALALDSAHAAALAEQLLPLVMARWVEVGPAGFTLTADGERWRDQWFAELRIAQPVSADRSAS